MWPAAERLWRARQRMRSITIEADRRHEITEGLAAFAAKEGRCPGIRDAIEGRLPFSHTTAIRYFGSWTAAVKSAGLNPRSRGGAGHHRNRAT